MSLFIYFILSCAAVSQSCSPRVWRQVVSHPAKHNVPETCYPDVKGPACSASDWIFGFYRYICKNKIKSIESLIFFSLTWRYAFFFFFFLTLMKLSHKILSVMKVVIKEWVLWWNLKYAIFFFFVYSILHNFICVISVK